MSVLSDRCCLLVSKANASFVEHVIDKYHASMAEERAGAVEERERDFKRKEFAIATRFGSRHTRCPRATDPPRIASPLPAATRITSVVDIIYDVFNVRWETVLDTQYNVMVTINVDTLKVKLLHYSGLLRLCPPNYWRSTCCRIT